MYPTSKFKPSRDTVVERVLTANSVDSEQNPTGLGPSNSVLINMGPAQGDSESVIQLFADGTIIFNVAGFYRAKLTLTFGRVTNPGVAEILFRVMIDGLGQSGRTVSQKISTANLLSTYELDAWVTVAEGTKIQFEIMRDSSGNNSGGLLAGTVTNDSGAWNPAPCATLLIDRPTNP